jgi:hypothetical protein
MDLFRQVQVVIADLIDPFIVVQFKIAIRIVIIAGRLYRNRDMGVPLRVGLSTTSPRTFGGRFATALEGRNRR